MRLRSLILAAFVFSVVTPFAHADLLIGDASGTDNMAAHSVLRYSTNANGDVAPMSSFGTVAAGTPLLAPLQMTYEPVEDVVYVSDFWGQAIRVYSANALGDTAPLRVFNTPVVGQPRKVLISTEHDEMIAIVSGCCIATYPRTASGNNVASLRYIGWGGSSGSVTRLTDPGGLALRKSSDTLIVPEGILNTSNNTYSGVILFFDRTADGNTAPIGSIEGSSTKLYTGAYEAVYDELHDEIIVVGFDNPTFSYRILTFAATARGNAAPLRNIDGPATLLDNVSHIAYDPTTETIYVTMGGYNNVIGQVLAFPRTADGNVAPLRTIAGPHTGTSYPIGVAVDTNHIFGNGFN